MNDIETLLMEDRLGRALAQMLAGQPARGVAFRAHKSATFARKPVAQRAVADLVRAARVEFPAPQRHRCRGRGAAPPGSERLPPAKAWKAGVVAVGGDPLAPRFDGQRGKPRILHQISLSHGTSDRGP